MNPQPFAMLTQCSTTEPQEHAKHADSNKLIQTYNPWVVLNHYLKETIHKSTLLNNTVVYVLIR